jgi:dihydrofolate reductase
MLNRCCRRLILFENRPFLKVERFLPLRSKIVKNGPKIKTKSNQMRNLIFAINTTLDGFCDHTKMIPDEEVFEYFTHLVQDAGTFLYGRITYQLMVPYWPDIAKNPSGHTKANYEYAQAFVGVDNTVVFSKSLDKPEGENTRIVRTNLQEEILKLKQEQGKNILTGGVNLPSQLAELGLIDEYRIVVHPIVTGEGRRLFEGINLQEKLRLKLAESKVFKSGAVALRYLKQ